MVSDCLNLATMKGQIKSNCSSFINLPSLDYFTTDILRGRLTPLRQLFILQLLISLCSLDEQLKADRISQIRRWISEMLEMLSLGYL